LDHANLLAFLEDKYLSTKTPLDLDGTTTADFTIDADAGSQDSQRFWIVFTASTTVPVTYSNVRAWQQGSNVAVQWAVENEINIQKYEVEKSADGITFAAVNAQAATAAAGTSVYNWLDENAVAGSN